MDTEEKKLMLELLFRNAMVEMGDYIILYNGKKRDANGEYESWDVVKRLSPNGMSKTTAEEKLNKIKELCNKVPGCWSIMDTSIIHDIEEIIND